MRAISDSIAPCMLAATWTMMIGRNLQSKVHGPVVNNNT